MLIYGHDAQIATWVCQQLKVPPYAEGLFKAIGITRNGRLIAGVVYNNFHLDAKGFPLLIEMTIVSVDNRWATRHNLGELFRYPFTQLKVRRVQATCHRKAKRVRTFLSRLGFTFEGIVRQAHPHGGDAAHYSMLKPECKWILREQINTISPSSTKPGSHSVGANGFESANCAVSNRA